MAFRVVDISDLLTGISGTHIGRQPSRPSYYTLSLSEAAIANRGESGASKPTHASWTSGR